MNDSAVPAELSRPSRDKWLARAGRALATVMMAVICAFVLQRSTHLDWANRPPNDVLIAPLDVAVIVILIAGLWALIGRLRWALALVTGLTVLMAGINRTKIELRHEPVFPSDRNFVSNTNSLVGMVDGSVVLRTVLPILVAVVLIAVIGRLVARRFPTARIRLGDGAINRRLVGLRVGGLVVSAGLLVHAANFNEPHNMWRALYDVDAQWKPWSQVHNYRSNGFVGGFLYNMPVEAMGRPEGYGAPAMEDLAGRYTERATQINAERTGSLDDVNVVFILSESFSDPSWMNGFTLAENPVPLTQQLMTETIAGANYSTSYGGGTATQEFESLTGQPIGMFRPQVVSPYQMFVTEHQQYPSVVGSFNSMGHRTVAIHPYNLHMYKRVQVYQTLGFDQVIDENLMQSTHRIATSRYISDESGFDETLYQIDRHEGPLFVNLVTMQNHGRYEDSYPNPIDSDLADPEVAERIGQYTRGLAHTDAALADFLTELRERDETTIVVFYGDHHPGAYDDLTKQLNEHGPLYRTPFFVWNSDTNQAQPVRAITPAMLLPLMYEAADAPVPPYVALLDDVRRTVPVIQHARLLDAEGSPLDRGALDAETQALLDDLAMVQYDFSIGDRLAVDVMWPGALGEPTGDEMESGHRPIG